MKRLPADLPDADALRALIDEQGRLAVRATPGARSETITITGTSVGVKVRAKPQDGAANTAVIRLVARAFDLALFEQGMRVGNNILVMVWMTDDEVVSEMVDADEEACVRYLHRRLCRETALLGPLLRELKDARIQLL